MATSISHLKSFQANLQSHVDITDRQWNYQIPNLPKPQTLNAHQLIKSVIFTSNAKIQEVKLRLEKASINRAVNANSLGQFLIVSFADFRLRVPLQESFKRASDGETKIATARESADYIVRVLRSGIQLNGVQYNFYGHSNSQLKSRTCFLYAGTRPDISAKIEALGDFTKIKTVAKKSKRIGLLFSTAQMATTVKPERCEDIPDVETKDYIFTDGCGLISPHLAHELVKKVGITFRNKRYMPSVFQIRYRGYKGVVNIDPAMKGLVQLKLRKSMKKFSGGTDFSFSVVDYSKPYRYGYLNDESILLLSALGIPEEILLAKQKEHFDFLASASRDPRAAFRFLTYVGQMDLAERLLMEGIERIGPSITRLVNSEFGKMLNKRDEQRCRILVPHSRLLFGICDAWGVLKEGECAVKITMDGDGLPRALKNTEVLVTRNPCLHPGDLQKFRVVERDELSHLVDCIVFSTQGKRPSADLMSGGDLDGDTFFVCWDSDLIPWKLSQPAEYPGAKEAVAFKAITDDDRLEYFARYTNASLGRVKNLFLDWARLKGPMSPECQQLNRLFSQCVDGNRIKVPQSLESPPQPPETAPQFILDILHEDARRLIFLQQNRYDGQILDGFDFDAMELLLSRDDLALSEFELITLAQKWCLRNSANLTDFLEFFNLNVLTVEEKQWVLSILPSTKQVPSLVRNALCQSSLVTISELQQFKLDYPGFQWKCIFNSSDDRLATFLDSAARALELFHKKLIVLRVDERLTLAIYVPRKVERGEEIQIDDQARLFAFVHTQGAETGYRLALPTKKNYRLYCDSGIFQLFEGKRANTWVFIGRGASDDSQYRALPNAEDRRRGRQATVDSGINFDCKASIALNKFSQGLSKHLGRVNRNGVLGAEIYVISNKDVKSMQNLDLWLQYVGTREIMPLFEKVAKEYTVPKLSQVDWLKEPNYIVTIVKEGKLSVLKTFASREEFAIVFQWLLEKDEKQLLFDIFKYLLGSDTKITQPDNYIESLKSMVYFLKAAPFLSTAFAQISLWAELPEDIQEWITRLAPQILHAMVLSANSMKDLAVGPFKKLVTQLEYITLEAFASLMELIAITVRSPDIALDFIFECLEPESARLLTGQPALISHFVRTLSGVVLDHIDQSSQESTVRDELLHLKFDAFDVDGWAKVSCQLRIDAPGKALATSDHVRLTAASSPANSIVRQKYSMDALVEKSESGRVVLRCFHSPPHFLEECSWKLTNCGSFVTAKTMLDSIERLALERNACCGIFDLIVGAKPSGKVQKSIEVPDISKNDLNPSQFKAVEAALSSSLTCLWGPPGTGKTHTIVEIIKNLQELPMVSRILVTAPTHNAVDNVMRKYLACVSDHMKAATLRVSTDVRKVSPDIKKYTCDAMLGKEVYTNFAALKKARAQIKNCNLIFTTCIGAGLGLLREETFDTVIIDEASQQTEPESLVPLVKGCQKAILVGDHVQLRATVQQHAILAGYDVSLFERLYKQDNESRSNGISKVMLDTQYRMHGSICHFSSTEFYEGKLLTGTSTNNLKLTRSEFPWPIDGKDYSRIVFSECSTPEDLGKKSKSNQGQAELCRKICDMLCKSSKLGEKNASDLNTQSIAVLTPYSRQVELLKRVLSHIPSAEVSSIDGFQGREADIVVFVTVRCNAHYEIGFLKDLRRMNVALTRAKAGLIVIGDRKTLTLGNADEESTAVWKRLLRQLVEVRFDG